MIVNVVGTNYAGKTTLIENSLRDHPAAFLDIRNYRNLIAPDFYRTSTNAVGPWPMQWRMARKHPKGPVGALRVLASGRPALAARFWRYFFIHAALVDAAPRLAPGRDLVIVDEGLPKKFIEAVPFVTNAESDAVRREWDEVIGHHMDEVVAALAGIVDKIVWVDADADDIVSRARNRTPDFLARVGEDAVRTRHEIQKKAFEALMAEAARAGFPTALVNSSLPDAQARFNAALGEKE